MYALLGNNHYFDEKNISSTRHHLFLDTWARVVLTLLYFALIDGRKKHSIHCFRILNWMILRRAFSIFQSGFQFIPRIFYIIPMYVCENLGKSETCSCFGRKQSCLLIVCFRISLVSCWNSFKRYRIESLWMTFDPLFNETIFNLSLWIIAYSIPWILFFYILFIQILAL